MTYFKKFKTELKVARAIKILEATLFILVAFIFSYNTYNGSSIIYFIMSFYALYLSFKLARELQRKRYYTKINIGFTIGLIIYFIIVLSTLEYIIIGIPIINILSLIMILLFAINFYSKKISDKIFNNFNLVATIGETISKMSDEEFKEYSKKLNEIFKDIEEELEKHINKNIDETIDNTDENTNKNQTKTDSKS